MLCCAALPRYYDADAPLIIIALRHFDDAFFDAAD